MRKSVFETPGSVACLKQTRTRSVEKADLYETILKGLNGQVLTSRSLSNHIISIKPATFQYSNLLFYLLTKFFVQPTFSFKGYMVNVAAHTRLSCYKFWLLQISLKDNMSKTKHNFLSRTINRQSFFVPVNFNFAILGQWEIYSGRLALYPIYQN